VVEHSERESHLTPPLDALQWTIFSLVTIQHQNRQIKITSHPRPIDGARAPAGAAQLSHQTLTGFGSRPILRCGSAQTRQRFPPARYAVSSGALRFSRRALPYSWCALRLSLRALRGSTARVRGAEHAFAICYALRARHGDEDTHIVLQNAVRSPVKHARRRSSILSRETCDARVVDAVRELTCWQVDSMYQLPFGRLRDVARGETNVTLLLPRFAVLLAQRHRRAEVSH
jgi:hypothetical protein